MGKSLAAPIPLPDFPSTPEREHKYTSSFDELDGVDFPDDMLKRFSFSSSTSHVSSPARIEVPETNPKRKALPLRTRSEELPISPGCRRQLDSAKQEKRLYMLRQMAIYSQPPDTLAAKTRAAARRGRKCRRDRYNSAPEMPPTSPRSTASSSSSSSASDRRLKKLSFSEGKSLHPCSSESASSAGRVFRINPKFEYTLKMYAASREALYHAKRAVHGPVHMVTSSSVLSASTRKRTSFTLTTMQCKID